MKHIRVMVATALLATACGGADDAENNGDSGGQVYPDLEPAEPLDLQDVELGVGVRHGEALGMAYGGAAAYEEATANLDHAFLWVQAYDEAARVFGEYHIYPAPPDVADARTASDFLGAQAPAARFTARAADLYEELDEAAAEGGGSFGARSIVLDLFRLRGDWWVRWDGNLDDEVNRVGKGPYGFNRADMYEDLLDQIEQVAESQQPRYFILGDEVERLLADSDGPGLSAAEFSNFMAFYHEAAARIHEASPETRVGAGINWDRFVSRVAPDYATGEETSHIEVLDRAFAAVVLPFAEAGDVVALQSYRDVDDVEIEFPVNNLPVEEAYQFLRRLGDLYALEKPIVFYSIGTPVESPVSYLRQRNYLEQFAQWVAGIEPELVVWRYLANIDGTDTANQMVSGRCQSLTESTRDFELPLSTCYDGLFTSVFSAKEPFDHLTGE